MSGSYSLLGKMRDRPYAIGERGPGSTVPTMPLLSGQAAFDSLTGYYPTRRMDSKLNPHNQPMRGGARATNKPHTKVAGLRALYQSCVKRAAVQSIFDDPAAFERDHPLVAGFLIKCGESDLDDAQIGAAISLACRVCPDLRKAFEKTAFGGAGIDYSGKTPMSAAASPKPLLSKPAVPSPAPQKPGVISQGLGNAGNFLKGFGTMLGGGVGTAIGGVGQAGARATDAVGLTEGATPMADAFGKTMQDAVRSGASSAWSGLSNKTPRDASQQVGAPSVDRMRRQHINQLRGMSPNDSLLGMSGPQAAGTYNAASETSDAALQALTTRGMPVPGAKALSSLQMMQSPPADLVTQTIEQAQRSPDASILPNAVANTDAYARGASGQGPAKLAPDAALAAADQGANDPLQMSEMKQFAAQAPEQAKEFAGQVSEQIKQSGEQVNQALETVQKTGDVPPAMQETGVKSLVSEYGDKAMDLWSSLDGGQKLMLGLGLGTAAVGLISALTSEEGGVMPWLMSILGLGAAAFPLAQKGVLGEGAQGVAGQIGGLAGQAKDKVMGMMGGQKADPTQAATAQLTGEGQPVDQARDGLRKAFTAAAPRMSAQQLAQQFGPQVAADPDLAGNLDLAAEHYQGRPRESMWDITNQDERIVSEMTAKGIPADQVPKVIEAWRIFRKGQPAT